MKTECTSRIASLNLRVLTHFVLYATGFVLAFGPLRNAVAGDNAAPEINQSAPAHAPGKWRATGDLGTARFSHTATLLLNGQGLVAGGVGSDGLTVLASAELYDPATGVWTATGNMHAPRESHTATLRPNGQVLVVNGVKGELYDPATGMWTATGNLTTARSGHTATLLLNGQVLVAGGASNGVVI